MMASKALILVALATFASVGLSIPLPPDTGYLGHAAPLAYAADHVEHHAAAPLAYSAGHVEHAAPVAYAAAAPAVSYAPVAPAVAYKTVAAPVAKAVITKTVDLEHDPHPQYSYSYDVNDGITGDSKTQQETRDGDVVHGSYSFIESDGTRRIVEYTADDHNGFNAVVHKEPAAHAVKAVAAVAPVVAKVHAAPAVATYAAAPSVAYKSYVAPAVAAYAAAPAHTLVKSHHHLAGHEYY